MKSARIKSITASIFDLTTLLEPAFSLNQVLTLRCIIIPDLEFNKLMEEV